MTLTNKFKNRHRYPWSTIKLAIKLSKDRYTSREVSQKLLDKGIEVSYKTICEWVKKFKKEALKKDYPTDLISK